MIRGVLCPVLACFLLAAPSFVRAEDQFFDSGGVKITDQLRLLSFTCGPRCE